MQIHCKFDKCWRKPEVKIFLFLVHADIAELITIFNYVKLNSREVKPPSKH